MTSYKKMVKLNCFPKLIRLTYRDKSESRDLEYDFGSYYIEYDIFYDEDDCYDYYVKYSAEFPTRTRRLGCRQRVQRYARRIAETLTIMTTMTIIITGEKNDQI